MRGAAPGRYCEGMLKQDQAGSTLQLLHFMVITEPLIGAKALQLAVAAAPKLPLWRFWVEVPQTVCHTDSMQT